VAEFAPFLMVVAIVAIVSYTRLQRAKHGIVRDSLGNETPIRDPDADRMRDELRALKERVAVLERIATDAHSHSSNLEREIDALRRTD
jgi:hypothetical protein